MAVQFLSLRFPVVVASVVCLVVLGFLTQSSHLPSDQLRWPPGTSSCAVTPRSNLAVSAIDGEGMFDQIFQFMGSLDTALGNHLLAAQRAGQCPPAAVEVKIITPPTFARNLPDGFRGLLRRYPNLEFVGALPERDISVLLNRFAGFSNLVHQIGSSYDKILVCDLDIVFQRDPFSMSMPRGVELLFFAEWRGLKIGQDGVHRDWFEGCSHTSDGAFITQKQISNYNPLDRICAGSTYGTAGAIAVYLDLMTSQLADSQYECNDQALHIHIYYSDRLNKALAAQSLGRAYVVPNEEALLGTIGTTPYVRYNEWGEILNEIGQVQVAVHQFKKHDRLSQFVSQRYAAKASLSPITVPPPPPVLVVDEGYHDSSEPDAWARFLVQAVDENTCTSDDTLCSCRIESCQFDY